MNVYIITTVLGCLSIASALPSNPIMINSTTQAKRDLSLSYAATDIGSKEGTRVKTITVIKNIVGKKDKPLKIDPELHKSDNWGSEFRDTFNSYGVIPDVPDIDDLFEFVNKKEDEKPGEKDDNPTKQSEKKDEKPEDNDDEEKNQEDVTEKSTPIPSEEAGKEKNDGKIEKIHGDAELLQPSGQPGKVKSQSLDLGKYSVHENNADVNYSTPTNLIRQTSSNDKKNGKYIQSPSKFYFYQEPSRTFNGVNTITSGNNNGPRISNGPGSVSVTTPSGRKFDVPVQQLITSSQRPYIAPNIRKNYEAQLNVTTSNGNSNCGPDTAANTSQKPVISVYQTRINSFSTNRPKFARSRGLRY